MCTNTENCTTKPVLFSCRWCVVEEIIEHATNLQISVKKMILLNSKSFIYFVQRSTRYQQENLIFRLKVHSEPIF